MSAALWQVEITEADVPVATLPGAVDALVQVGITFDAIEVEDAETGTWLVGLLGRHADEANRGDSFHESEGDTVVYLPQP